MTTPTNRPPLWRVMRQADSSAASDYQSPEARMLRAIADWLVPEEDEPAIDKPFVIWRTKRTIRDQLLAEADRAEAGE